MTTEETAVSETNSEKKTRNYSKHDAPPAAKKKAAKKTKAEPAEKKPVTAAALTREGNKAVETAKKLFFKASEVERKEKLKAAREEVKSIVAEKKEAEKEKAAWDKVIAEIDKRHAKAVANLERHEKMEANAAAMKS